MQFLVHCFRIMYLRSFNKPYLNSYDYFKYACMLLTFEDMFLFAVYKKMVVLVSNPHFYCSIRWWGTYQLINVYKLTGSLVERREFNLSMLVFLSSPGWQNNMPYRLCKYTALVHISTLWEASTKDKIPIQTSRETGKKPE